LKQSFAEKHGPFSFFQKPGDWSRPASRIAA